MKDKIKNAQRLITDAQGGKANIKGKEYTTVPLRVEVFRSNLDDEDLKSSPNVYTHLKIFENRVISKTYLAKNIDIHLDEEGKEIVTMESVIAVGTAEELRDSSMINKTSAVEVRTHDVSPELILSAEASIVKSKTNKVDKKIFTISSR